MEYKLTKKYQHSKKCNDNRRRNFLIFFLNDIQIFKQKVPYDENFDHGCQNRTSFDNIYLLNGYINQKRQSDANVSCFGNEQGKMREVKYPVSKKILEQFNIPKDLKITLSND